VGFAEKTGLRVVFGLNLMFGRGPDGSGPWDPSNAEAFLKATAAAYPSFSHGFGLGNEKEFVVGPRDTARCYNTLRAAVNRYAAMPCPLCHGSVYPALGRLPCVRL
jgi:hypothetical protein